MLPALEPAEAIVDGRWYPGFVCFDGCASAGTDWIFAPVFNVDTMVPSCSNQKTSSAVDDAI
jgi:hypothetical protein